MIRNYDINYHFSSKIRTNHEIFLSQSKPCQFSPAFIWHIQTIGMPSAEIMGIEYSLQLNVNYKKGAVHLNANFGLLSQDIYPIKEENIIQFKALAQSHFLVPQL